MYHVFRRYDGILRSLGLGLVQSSFFSALGASLSFIGGALDALLFNVDDLLDGYLLLGLTGHPSSLLVFGEDALLVFLVPLDLVRDLTRHDTEDAHERSCSPGG